MMTRIMPKNAKKYTCDNCNFKCSKKSNYNKHILTAKHQMMTNDDINDDNKMPVNAKAFTCDCGIEYKYRQGLSVHKQKCTYKMPNSWYSASGKNKTTLFVYLVTGVNFSMP